MSKEDKAESTNVDSSETDFAGFDGQSTVIGAESIEVMRALIGQVSSLREEFKVIKDEISAKTRVEEISNPFNRRDAVERGSNLPLSFSPPPPPNLAAKHKLYDLPPFSGQPEQWPRFIAQFEHTTAEYGYSNLDNLIRLTKCLSGKALKLVDALLILPEDVPKAIDTLKCHFGRPHQLIASQIHKIKQFSALVETDVNRFIDYASQVKVTCSFLKSVGATQHLRNPSLLKELIDKLPFARKLEWTRVARKLEREPCLESFSAWLDEVAKDFIEIDSASRIYVPIQKPRRAMCTSQRTIRDAETCLKCKAVHAIQDCQKFVELSLNDKWEFVKDNKLCFCCLKARHQVAKCFNKVPCRINGCRKPHHSLLHEVSFGTVPRETSNSVLSARTQSNQVWFKIIPVIVSGPRGQIETLVFLDDGANVSMMAESLANNLGLQGPNNEVILQWYDGAKSVEQTMTIDCEIKGCRSSRINSLREVQVVKKLSLPRQSLDVLRCKKQFQYLKDVPLVGYQSAVPELLIGLDNVHAAVPMGSVSRGLSGPVAIETPLGWTLVGPSRAIAQPIKTVMLLYSQSTEAEKDKLNQLEEMVKNYFATENLFVDAKDVQLLSKDEEQARSIVKSSICRHGARFECALPGRENVTLPDGYEMAKRRLLSLEKKFRSDAQLKQAYDQQILCYIRKGYARKLTVQELAVPHQRVFYLPHFSVTNPHKPDKLRVVFDAAAKVNGVSLNDCLLTGPDINQLLVVVLSKFRQGKIAICGDIREMFPQIKINAEDQHALRFLYRSDPREPIEIYIMMSLIFGACCSPFIAQFVKNHNANDFKEAYPNAVKAITENHYVDDYVASYDTAEEAIAIAQQVRYIHSQGGFELVNLISNATEVSKALADNYKVQPSQEYFLNRALVLDKVLGVYWNIKDDTFAFQLKLPRVPQSALKKERPFRKREALSLIMSVYDPFGFVENFTIIARVILQKTWNCGTNWDDPLPHQLQRQLENWVDELCNVAKLTIPRWYGLAPSRTKVELHIFVDASETAYAAVAYWRIFNHEDTRIAFVAGKSKCAPKRLISIPRLELQGAVLGARMRESILRNHTIRADTIFMYTDSKTVLLWIQSEVRRYRPYVAHRISEILNKSNVNEWSWVPSHENPADEATRVDKVKFNLQSRWLNGPAFLINSTGNEAEQPADLNEFEVPNEVKKQNLTVLVVHDTSHATAALADPRRFSKYWKLVRTVAWVNRFIGKKRYVATDRELSKLELESAEKSVIYIAQNDAYPVEFMRLRQGMPLDAASPLSSLNPIIDKDGLLRANGRLTYASAIPFSMRQPLILPKNHRVTHLLLQHTHDSHYHQNSETVICTVRQKFWVPQIRSQLNKVVRSCQLCKIRRAKPIVPLLGPLPIDRLDAGVHPFSYCGIDYFGPMTIAVGKRQEKRWIALFTCLTYRAVHVEIAFNDSTDALILCLRNFFNIRGIPKRIRSDNGTNFIGLKKELANAVDFFDWNVVRKEFSPMGIEWLFNSPKDPQAGGCWERMVQSIKRTLYAALKERTPQLHTLQSFLLEAVNIVNSRSLTHIPMEVDQEEPLTPNHFLLGHANSTQTPAEPSERLMCLRKQWRISQQLKNYFHKRFWAEYLPTLISRGKNRREVPPLQEGQLVFVCDPEIKRGIIVTIFPGKDGQVRAADVQTTTGILRRPAHKLAVLDVSNGESRSIHGERDVIDPCGPRLASPELWNDIKKVVNIPP